MTHRNSCRFECQTASAAVAGIERQEIQFRNNAEQRLYHSKQAQNQYEHKPDGYYGCSREEMLPFVPVQARTVLEIGCGEGDFLHLPSKRNRAEVYGIEPNSSAASSARSKGLQVYEATAADIDQHFPTTRFDAIVLNDVLEHLANPADVLDRCRNALSGDGVLIASIPNLRYWTVTKNLVFRGEFEYTSHGVMDETHVRFFTRKSIRKMFLRCGFSSVQLTGINSTGSKKFALLNAVLFNRLSDMRFHQFAVVARVYVRQSSGSGQPCA